MTQITKSFVLLLMTSFLMVGCEQYDNVNPLNNALTQEDLQGKWLYEHDPEYHPPEKTVLTFNCDHFTLTMKTFTDMHCWDPDKAVIRGNFELKEEKIKLEGRYKKEKLSEYCRDHIKNRKDFVFVKDSSFHKTLPFEFDDGQLILNPEKERTWKSHASFQRSKDSDRRIGYFKFNRLPMEKIEEGECEKEL